MTEDSTSPDELCDACGGCGILITSWDGVLLPEDNRVFVDTCDQCTTGKQGLGKFNRTDASYAIAATLECDILLVRNPGYSFKDAIVAKEKVVNNLLNKWNEEGKTLKQILAEVSDREKQFD